MVKGTHSFPNWLLHAQILKGIHSFSIDCCMLKFSKECWAVQVKGVLDKEEVLFAKNKGYLYGTHVVVGLPECLAEASKEPHAVAIMQHTLAVAVDEVDACFLVSMLSQICNMQLHFQLM